MAQFFSWPQEFSDPQKFAMAITRTGKRTGADKKTCRICWGYRPDMAEPDEPTCVAAMAGNVRGRSEYKDPAVAEQEQRDDAREEQREQKKREKK